MIDIKKTHLTKRQFEVLKRRREGKSLTEIAAELRTSRSNISRIAIIAEQNVEKARNTLKLVESFEWPVRIDAKAGSNIFEISEKVFRAADEKNIRVSRNYSEIVRLITEALGGRNLRRRKALKDFSIVVSKEGRVEIF